MTFIGVVCGLKSEAAAAGKAARALRGAEDRVRIGVSGADSGRAEAIARRFAREGAATLLSVGVSGGLDPGLATGALVATSDVQSASGRIEVRRASVAPVIVAAGASAPTIVDALIYGSDKIIRTSAEKAALFRETGAVAVDMESHGAAKAASDAGLPFLALRAVADPASRAIPNAALGAVAEDGGTRVLPTLLRCARAPQEFPALLQLGADSAEALRALSRGLGLFLGGLLLRLDF